MELISHDPVFFFSRPDDVQRCLIGSVKLPFFMLRKSFGPFPRVSSSVWSLSSIFPGCICATPFPDGVPTLEFWCRFLYRFLLQCPFPRIGCDRFSPSKRPAFFPNLRSGSVSHLISSSSTRAIAAGFLVVFFPPSPLNWGRVCTFGSLALWET